MEELGIEPVETRISRIADGTQVEMQTSWARFSAAGQNTVARVSFGPEGIFLLDATTLEDMCFAIDPVDLRLIPQETLLM